MARLSPAASHVAVLNAHPSHCLLLHNFVFKKRDFILYDINVISTNEPSLKRRPIEAVPIQNWGWCLAPAHTAELARRCPGRPRVRLTARRGLEEGEAALVQPTAGVAPQAKGCSPIPKRPGTRAAQPASSHAGHLVGLSRDAAGAAMSSEGWAEAVGPTSRGALVPPHTDPSRAVEVSL